MGGPCWVRVPAGRKHLAPACTDNFQLRPFAFAGVEWQSVEQCYQALKFTDLGSRERVRLLKPFAGESASAHGMRVWKEGQRGRDLRPDWDAVKVEVMYRANRAKYARHEDLRAELLGTGSDELVGGPSTSWQSPAGRPQKWSEWNGLIQMRLREELRAPEDRDPELLELLVAKFDTYLAGEGGCRLPLPEDPETPEVAETEAMALEGAEKATGPSVEPPESAGAADERLSEPDLRDRSRSPAQDVDSQSAPINPLQV